MSDGALSSSLFYSNLPAAVQSTSLRSSIAPANGSSFTGQNSSVIKIEVPLSIPGQYMDPTQTFLKLSVAVQTGSTVTVDNMIYSIFDQMQISHNGVVLESIQQYGHLCNLLGDLTVGPSVRNQDLNILAGTSASNNQTGISLASDSTKTWFCIPLVSGILGIQQKKFIPVGRMKGTLSLDLTLSPYGMNCNVNTTALTYTVQDVELMAHIVQVNPRAEEMIHQQAVTIGRGYYQIPCTSWRNFSSSVSHGNTAASVLIPVKVQSLKNMLVSQRLQTACTDISGSKNYAPARLGCTDFATYWFRVGSQMVPSRQVTNVVEAYAELLKSLHNFNFTTPTQLTRATYNTGSAFAIGLECESFSHRSSEIHSGLSTRDISLFLEIAWTGAISANRRLDFFCNHDLLLLIDDSIGQATVEF